MSSTLFTITINQCELRTKHINRDLFCGTGSIGIEALSRGVKKSFSMIYNSKHKYTKIF